MMTINQMNMKKVKKKERNYLMICPFHLFKIIKNMLRKSNNLKISFKSFWIKFKKNLLAQLAPFVLLLIKNFSNLVMNNNSHQLYKSIRQHVQNLLCGI